MLGNLKRNIPYLDEYDEKSFIGYWLNCKVWSDIEYWKLEADLLKIRHFDEVENDTLASLMRIVKIMMVADKESYSFLKTHEQYTISDDEEVPSLYYRFERFSVVLSNLFNSEINIEDISFYYEYIEKNRY